MTEQIEALLKKIPNKPWVYQMKNSKGAVIYVWKSVNLKSRVNSYFNTKNKLNFAKKKMVELICDIEIIQTKNEVEALVLETNLIKKLKPKYNILMKDDKNLTYIKLTSSEIPEVIKTRIKNKDGEYFWPYTSTMNIYSILQALKKIFKIRSCKADFTKDDSWKLKITWLSWRSVPCLDFYIWLCPAPCTLEESKIQEYKDNIQSLKAFFRGDDGQILKSLEAKMLEKAKAMEFEEASKLRDQIKSINELKEKQLARDAIPWDNDVIVLYEKYWKVFVWLTEIRGSQIFGITYTKIEDKLEQDAEETFVSYLQTRYVDEALNSINIITNIQIKDEVLITFLKSKKISIESPSIWPKLEALNFTKNNLLNFAYKDELSQIWKRTLTKNTQANILKLLWYETKNSKEIIFECFDISHLWWTNTVASKSVIINWKSVNSKYKKYKLKTISTWEIDDFKSMEEIMQRRVLEWIKLNNFPDLFIIDWWKWQLSSADWEIKKTLESIPEADRPTYNICSIAKREEELFVPWKKDPIIIEKWTPELALIQKIRDEAHRFAINFNREKRNIEMKKNILEEIPWLWPKARQKLLKAAWSVDNIATLDREELEKLINKSQIEKLEEHWII